MTILVQESSKPDNIEEESVNLEEEKEYWRMRRQQWENYLVNEKAEFNYGLGNFENQLFLDNVLSIKEIQQTCPFKKEEKKLFDNYKQFKTHFTKGLSSLQKQQKQDQQFTKQDREIQQTIPESEEYKWTKPSSHFLALWEVERIRIELNKLVNCDYDVIDSIIRPIQFFTKFNAQIRTKLLQCVKFISVKKNEIIFKQGDNAGHLYVILYGSIAVIKTIDTDQGPEERLIVCLYDGQHFGEMSIFLKNYLQIAILGGQNSNKSVIDDIKNIKTVKDAKDFIKKEKQKEIEQEKLKDYLILKKLKQTKSITFYRLKNEESDKEAELSQEEEEKNQFQQKRGATCKAIEDSYFLQLPQYEFKKVMTQFVQKEQDKKLKILINLRMFRGFEPFSLIPISNVLALKKYSYGEVILQEGEIMNNLFFISTGRVRLVKKQLEYRSKFPSKLISHLQKSPNHFNCGIADCTSDLFTSLQDNHKKNAKENKFQKEKQKNASNQKIFWTGEGKRERLYSFSKPKPSNPDKITKKRDDYNAFYNIIEYHNIGIGDIFGGRGFYEKEEKNKLSKLTFLADSYECEIYALDEANFCCIPDYLQKILIEGLIQLPDYDNIDTTNENKKNLQWIKCKQKVYQEELNQIASPAAKSYIHYKQF